MRKNYVFTDLHQTVTNKRLVDSAISGSSLDEATFNSAVPDKIQKWDDTSSYVDDKKSLISHLEQTLSSIDTRDELPWGELSLITIFDGVRLTIIKELEKAFELKCEITTDPLSISYNEDAFIINATAETLISEIVTLVNSDPMLSEYVRASRLGADAPVGTPGQAIAFAIGDRGVTPVNCGIGYMVMVGNKIYACHKKQMGFNMGDIAEKENWLLLHTTIPE